MVVREVVRLNAGRVLNVRGETVLSEKRILACAQVLACVQVLGGVEVLSVRGGIGAEGRARMSGACVRGEVLQSERASERYQKVLYGM